MKTKINKSEEFILIKDQSIPIYFESRYILNTNTVSLEDAKKFASEKEAIDYNNKYLCGEFEVLPVSIVINY